MHKCTFCVQDYDAVLRSPGYTRPAESDSAAQRLHHSQVGYTPHWLFLCTHEKCVKAQRNCQAYISTYIFRNWILTQALLWAIYQLSVPLLTSGCCGDRCSLLTTVVQGEQGDDVFCVGLKASKLVAASASGKGQALDTATWRPKISVSVPTICTLPSV